VKFNSLTFPIHFISKELLSSLFLIKGHLCCYCCYSCCYFCCWCCCYCTLCLLLSALCL